MSAPPDESDNETASFGEWECVSGECSVKSKGSASASAGTVIVQLPKDFLQQDQHEPRSSASSLGSSFCPRLSGMQIRVPRSNCNSKNKLFRSSSTASGDSSWASCTTDQYSAVSTVAYSTAASASSSSSVISGFDILSINGSTHRRCHRCTFLNAETAFICESCDAALSANPCTDVDHQIALNLQQKEEADFLQILQEQEAKRKLLGDLAPWQQAQTLATDIIQSVAGMNSGAGISTLAELDLTMHAARFIQHRRQRRADDGGDESFRIAYHFSTPLSTGTLEAVRVHGFRGPLIRVSTDRTVAHLQGQRPRGPWTARLPSIDESATIDETVKLGWIVAVFGPSVIEKSLTPLQNEADTAPLEIFSNTDGILPLVSFDASLMEENGDSIQDRLEKVLRRVCADFFWCLDGTLASQKRRKLDSDSHPSNDQDHHPYLPVEIRSSQPTRSNDQDYDDQDYDDQDYDNEMFLQLLQQDFLDRLDDSDQSAPLPTAAIASDDVWAPLSMELGSDGATACLGRGWDLSPTPLRAEAPDATLSTQSAPQELFDDDRLDLAGTHEKKDAAIPDEADSANEEEESYLEACAHH